MVLVMKVMKVGGREGGREEGKGREGGRRVKEGREGGG